MENIKLYSNRAYPPNKLSIYRRNSLAQKIRRDLIKLIIYNPKLENDKNILIKQIEDLLGFKFANVDELILHDFTGVFENNFYHLEKTKTFNINPTPQSLEFLKLFDKIKNKSLSIYIHGSHADGNTTNYSDMDVSIFINNKDEINLNRVRNDILTLNNYVKTLDLESHHSIFLNVNNDLDCYPESFMPLDVLLQSVMPKKQKLNVGKVRFSTDIAIDSFLRIFNSLNKVISQINNNNFYNIKFIISSYFMLIILNYEIVNMKFKDKKSIFNEIFLKKNNNFFLEIFNLCSEIREKWPTQKSNIDFGISKYLIKKIQKHSKYLIEEIDDSSSLKKTLDIILDK